MIDYVESMSDSLAEIKYSAFMIPLHLSDGHKLLDNARVPEFKDGWVMFVRPDFFHPNPNVRAIIENGNQIGFISFDTETHYNQLIVKIKIYGEQYQWMYDMTPVTDYSGELCTIEDIRKRRLNAKPRNVAELFERDLHDRFGLKIIY